MAEFLPTTKLVFTGNRDACAYHIKFAANQLEILKRQMELGGLREGVRRVEPYKGVFVECVSSFGHQEVLIHVEPGVVPVGREVIVPRVGFVPQFEEEPLIFPNYYIGGLWRNQAPLADGIQFEGVSPNNIHTVARGWRDQYNNLPGDYFQYCYTRSDYSTANIPLGATVCNVQLSGLTNVTPVGYGFEAPITIRTQGDYAFYQIKYAPEPVTYLDSDSIAQTKEVSFMVSMGEGERRASTVQPHGTQITHNITISTTELVEPGIDVILDEPRILIESDPPFPSYAAPINMSTGEAVVRGVDGRKFSVRKTYLNIMDRGVAPFSARNMSVNFNADKTKLYLAWSPIYFGSDYPWTPQSEPVYSVNSKNTSFAFDHAKRGLVWRTNQELVVGPVVHTYRVQTYILNREISTDGVISWVPETALPVQRHVEHAMIQYPFVSRDGEIYGFHTASEDGSNYFNPGGGITARYLNITYAFAYHKINIETGIVTSATATCAGNTIVDGEFAPYWVTYSPNNSNQFDVSLTEGGHNDNDDDWTYTTPELAYRDVDESSNFDLSWNIAWDEYNAVAGLGSATLLSFSARQQSVNSHNYSHVGLGRVESYNIHQGVPLGYAWTASGGYNGEMSWNQELRSSGYTLYGGSGGVGCVDINSTRSRNISWTGTAPFGTGDGREQGATFSAGPLKVVPMDDMLGDYQYSYINYRYDLLSSYYGTLGIGSLPSAYYDLEYAPTLDATLYGPYMPTDMYWRTYYHPRITIVHENDSRSNPALNDVGYLTKNVSFHQILSGDHIEPHASFWSWDHTTGIVVRGLKYSERYIAPIEEWWSTGYGGPDAVRKDGWTNPLEPEGERPDTPGRFLHVYPEFKSTVKCKIEIGNGTTGAYADMTSQILAESRLDANTFQYIGLLF